ncbi:Hypothetical predicted protein [Marmota monax]|uniref:Uncharacterized protein n=1 Tax=Marmota monax TaxID=9995 RepID=A0A5E4CMA1_MARMO|nr:hypothetical protein GHT09_019496 [Marmota monax]VTJ83024.1 Hypothetical predicted protein [Marmota monax]
MAGHSIQGCSRPRRSSTISSSFGSLYKVQEPSPGNKAGWNFLGTQAELRGNLRGTPGQQSGWRPQLLFHFIYFQ